MSTPGRKPLRRAIGDALPLTEPRRSFGLVLAAIVVAMIFQLAASSGDLTRFITIVLQSTVIVLLFGTRNKNKTTPEEMPHRTSAGV